MAALQRRAGRVVPTIRWPAGHPEGLDCASQVTDVPAHVFGLRESSSRATLKVGQQETLRHVDAGAGNVWGLHCDSFLGCELACRGSRPLCQRFEPRNRAAAVPARYKLPGPAGPGAGAQVEFAAAGWDACCSGHPNLFSACRNRARPSPPPAAEFFTEERKADGVDTEILCCSHKCRVHPYMQGRGTRQADLLAGILINTLIPFAPAPCARLRPLLA